MSGNADFTNNGRVLILGAGKTAHALIAQNKAAVEQIADALIERRELFGDELVEILESAKLKAPKLDFTKEAAWPVL